MPKSSTARIGEYNVRDFKSVADYIAAIPRRSIKDLKRDIEEIDRSGKTDGFAQDMRARAEAALKDRQAKSEQARQWKIAHDQMKERES